MSFVDLVGLENRLVLLFDRALGISKHFAFDFVPVECLVLAFLSEDSNSYAPELEGIGCTQLKINSYLVDHFDEINTRTNYEVASNWDREIIELISLAQRHGHARLENQIHAPDLLATMLDPGSSQLKKMWRSLEIDGTSARNLGMKLLSSPETNVISRENKLTIAPEVLNLIQAVEWSQRIPPQVFADKYPTHPKITAMRAFRTILLIVSVGLIVSLVGHIVIWKGIFDTFLGGFVYFPLIYIAAVVHMHHEKKKMIDNHMLIE